MKRCLAGRRSRFSSVVSLAKSLWQDGRTGEESDSLQRRRRARFSNLERLEPRTMLAADFLITEFMASNDSGLEDQDGDHSDWIEIQNVGNTAGSLQGWRLVDSVDQWVFPNVSVPAGGYITVFASNKNRAVAGAELHTNFALAGEGERLALLRPDQSIRQEFNPYPAQFPDASYGIVQDATPLVPSGANARFKVPIPADGSGTTWTGTSFNDSSWTSSLPSGNRQLAITEISTGTVDWFEFQNVSGAPLSTAGWFIAVNDGNEPQNINLVDPIQYVFPAGDTMPAGQLRYRTEDINDAANYFGSAIDWPTAGSRGWVMIVKPLTGTSAEVVDFVTWGYTAADLAGLNVNVRGVNITSTQVAAAWNGNPVNYAGSSSNSLQRQGNTDHDNSTDWAFVATPSQSITNAALTLPVAGAPIPVQTGIGFNTNPSGFTVNYYLANIPVDHISVAEQVILDPTKRTTTATVIAQTINYHNTGGGANFGGDLPFPTQTIGPDFNDFVIQATGTIVIPSAGQYTFGVNSDDGFSLQLTNGVNTFNMTHPTPRGPGDTLQTFNMPAGSYQARLVFYERGGGAEVELFAASGVHGAFNSNFKLVGDIAGGGLGTAGFGGAIKTNVQTQMMGTNASLWTRIPFNVSNPANLTSLTLRMKYNDGFRAYINGTLVASHNATSTAWNATATGSRNDGESSLFVDFNISSFINLLQAGPNILAIHGQNIASGNNTFLVLPEIVGTTLQPEQRFFPDPTPGQANVGQGVIGFVGDTTFSVGRGFYNTPFQVSLATNTPGATIRYTINGSDPSETNGSVYSGPITVSGTTVLRAAAFKAGFEPSNVDTQTYIFINDVVNQSPLGQAPAGWPTSWGANVVDYGMDPNIVNVAPWNSTTAPNGLKPALTAIPTISIVTPLQNLFDPTIGIYANPSGDGDSWEVPTSLELINPDGTPGFQIDAGLRIRGGYSRSTGNPKHSFRLFFRNEYGDGKLNYPLFGTEGADSFDKVDLRTAQNYSWSFEGNSNNAMIEEVWNRDTSRDVGQAYTRSRWYHLYLDGQYWGLYQTEERPDAAFGSTYFGGEREQWDTIKVDPDLGYNIEATDGDMNAWTAFYNLANTLRNAALTPTQRHAIYMQLQGKNPDGTNNLSYPVYLDTDNLIEYMQGIFYSGDRDAPISNFIGNTSPNNWYGIRNRDPLAREGWRFIMHDPEHTLTKGLPSRIGPFPAGDGNVFKSSPQWIHQMLMYSEEYRIRFGDLTRRNFFEMGADSGAFTAAEATARFNVRAAEIDNAIVGESARWGDSKTEPPRTRNNWLNAINNTRSFFTSRAPTIVTQLRSATLYGTGAVAPLYPSIEAPNFSLYGGQVAPGFNLTMTSPSGGTIYYTTDGSDPRLVGGGIKPGALTYAGGVSIPSSRVINARTLVGSTWSALTTSFFSTNVAASASNLAITEINYNPADPSAAELAVNSAFLAEDFEFIELRNIGAQGIDLSGVQFTAGITFNFPAVNGPILTPGQSLILVKNTAAFQARYGASIPIAGVYTGSLNNGGEQLTLRTAADVIIDDVTYSDSGAWPGRADGDGATLVIINPAGDPNNPDNWRSSTEYGGSPTALGLAAINTIVVNEVLTHTDPPLKDAVELYNPTAAAINIGGWYLSDGGQPLGNTDGLARYKKFRIPDGTSIPAGGYLVFDEDDFNTTPDVHPSFSFNAAHGDDVWLIQADPVTGKLLNFIDHVGFDAAANAESFGRWPNGTGELYPMITRTFGTPNSGPRIGPVVISELMYNPQSLNDDLEYIELLNVTDSPIDLAGWKFTSGVDFTFGATTLPARGTLLVLRFDPNNPLNAAKLAAFQAAYPGIPAGTIMVGGYAGTLEGGVLNNGGETVRLSRPDEPPANEPTFIPYLLVDEVKYDDVAPWPTSPDGTGPSLTRINTTLIYGNDPTNWTGSTASPGGLPVPGPVTNLQAAATASNKIHLAWTDGASNESGFRIERFDGANFVQIATAPANATAYDDVNLQSSVDYLYRVRAFNASGDGPVSNNANAITPQLVTITGTGAADAYYIVRAGSLLKVYENSAPVGQPAYSSELADMNGTLTIDGGADNDSLTVNSGGEATLGLTRVVYNSGGGANSLVFESGSARIDSTVEAGGTLNTTVQAGAQMTTAELDQHALTLGDNSRVTLIAGGEGSKLTSLTLGTGATLDVTDNSLVIDYTGDSPVAAIRASILSGRGGFGLGKVWNGTGITSSTAAQAPLDSRSVGYAENALLPLGAYSTFGGHAVDATSVLIAYTRTADANLDGVVNNDDVAVVGANYLPGSSKPAWALGDFEYNGFVDNDDVALLGVFYNPAPPPAPAPATLSAASTDEGWTLPDEPSNSSGSVAWTESVAAALAPATNVAAATSSVNAVATEGEIITQPNAIAPQAESTGGGAVGEWRLDLSEAADDSGELLDLLAASIASAEGGESLADARLAASARESTVESLWADSQW